MSGSSITDNRPALAAIPMSVDGPSGGEPSCFQDSANDDSSGTNIVMRWPLQSKLALKYLQDDIEKPMNLVLCQV